MTCKWIQNHLYGVTHHGDVLTFNKKEYISVIFGGDNNLVGLE